MSALASSVITADAVRRLWASDVEGSTAVGLGYLLVVSVLACVMIQHLQARRSAARALAEQPPAQGHEIRAQDHEPARVTIVLPVRPGEEGPLRRALLAAVLQEQSGLRIAVVAADGDSRPAAEPWHDAVVRLAADVVRPIDECWGEAAHAARAFDERAAAAGVVGDYEAHLLSYHLREGAGVLGECAGRLAFGDNGDRLLADRVLDSLAADLRDLAGEVERLANPDSVGVPTERLRAAYRRLSDIFGVRIEVVAEGASPPRDADFVVLLDVHTVLLPEYILRLRHVLQRPENDAVAGVRTPLAPIPDAPTQSGRVVGAVAARELLLRLGAARGRRGHGVPVPSIVRAAALSDIEAERRGGEPAADDAAPRPLAETARSGADRTSRANWTFAAYPERLAYGDLGLTRVLRTPPRVDVVAVALLASGIAFPLLASALGWAVAASPIRLGLLLVLIVPSVVLVAADLPRFPHRPLEEIGSTAVGVLLLPTTFVRLVGAAVAALLSPTRDRLRERSRPVTPPASSGPGSADPGDEATTDRPPRMRVLRGSCPRHAAGRGRSAQPAPPAFARRTPPPRAADAVDVVWWFPVQNRLALRAPQ